MLIAAKTALIDEISTFLKSLYVSRTGYPGHYKYRYYEPDGVSHGGREDRKMNTPEKHEGEYVLTSSGSKDFGEITPEISKFTGRQAGKIRLETGYHNDSTGEGFGEIHIERDARIKQLRQNGFNNARDFVENVSAHFDSVYKGAGTSLILSMKNAKNRNIEYVELKPSENGDFWSVLSGLVAHEGYLKNKTLLWNKSNNSV